MWFFQIIWKQFVQFCKLPLEEASCEIGSVRPFVHPFIRLFVMQDIRIGSTIFYVFCMKLDSLKVLKMMEPNFWKIVQSVRRAQKSQKCTKNEVFGEFWRKSHPFIRIFFYLNTKLLTFFENCISEKNLVFEPKTLDQTECRITSTAISHKRVDVWGSIFVCDWTSVEATNLFS